jgi:hypothetical protein
MHYISLINGQGFSVEPGKRLMYISRDSVDHYWNVQFEACIVLGALTAKQASPVYNMVLSTFLTNIHTCKYS